MTRPAMPVPTPESEFYWAKATAGELWIQRCVESGKHFFYPRATSPFVLGGAVEWVQACGRATLHTYNIVHRPAPGFEDRGPYALAVVELEEGPRMMSSIVGVENTPEHLVLDMALEVDFEPRGALQVPVFRPLQDAA